MVPLHSETPPETPPPYINPKPYFTPYVTLKTQHTPKAPNNPKEPTHNPHMTPTFPPPPPVPWTLSVNSARALCFLGFFPKTSLGLGSRLALQCSRRGRRSIGSLSDDSGNEEETVNLEGRTE